MNVHEYHSNSWGISGHLCGMFNFGRYIDERIKIQSTIGTFSSGLQGAYKRERPLFITNTDFFEGVKIVDNIPSEDGMNMILSSEDRTSIFSSGEDKINKDRDDIVYIIRKPIDTESHTTRLVAKCGEYEMTDEPSSRCESTVPGEVLVVANYVAKGLLIDGNETLLYDVSYYSTLAGIFDFIQLDTYILHYRIGKEHSSIQKYLNDIEMISFNDKLIKIYINNLILKYVNKLCELAKKCLTNSSENNYIGRANEKSKNALDEVILDNFYIIREFDHRKVCILKPEIFETNLFKKKLMVSHYGYTLLY
jgi:hypothetical protein